MGIHIHLPKSSRAGKQMRIFPLIHFPNQDCAPAATEFRLLLCRWAFGLLMTQSGVMYMNMEISRTRHVLFQYRGID